jgi:RNA polymerase sigma-70 factor (ECF subfamily)
MSRAADAGDAPHHPDHLTDDALVDRARRDRRAFAPLYDRYAEPVYRYCFRRLGNHEAAADATSQTFLKALAALPSYRQGTFRGWLFTIAANVVTDHHRRARPVTSLDHDPAACLSLVDAAPSPEERALTNESAASVEALLATLTGDQRRVVELRLAGLTGPEIATALGLSETAVRSSQFRAYNRLRRLVTRSGREDIHHAR